MSDRAVAVRVAPEDLGVGRRIDRVAGHFGDRRSPARENVGVLRVGVPRGLFTGFDQRFKKPKSFSS